MVSGLVFAAAYGLAQPARAELIVDQRRFPYGGQVSDTESISFGELLWEELADDILLTNDATVRQIRWWGFYGGESCGVATPPVGNEPMRVRFYEARSGDELPGTLVYEETFPDAHRFATGEFVNDVGLRPEFNYWANPSTPVTLLAGRRYWLSVAQVGIPNSCFRWEFSDRGLGMPYSLQWSYEPYWQYSMLGPTVGQAFQLFDVPEPGGMLLMGAGLGFVIVVFKSRKEGGARKGVSRASRKESDHGGRST